MHFTFLGNDHSIALLSLHFQATQKNKELLKRCKTLTSLFWITPFAFNKHLQLVLFILRTKLSKAVPLSRYCSQLAPRAFCSRTLTSQTLKLSDAGEITLKWHHPPSIGQEAPIVIFLHGISGCTKDFSSFQQGCALRGWRSCDHVSISYLLMLKFDRSVGLDRRGHGGNSLKVPFTSNHIPTTTLIVPAPLSPPALTQWETLPTCAMQ